MSVSSDARRKNIGVDARPLAHSATGIGRYLSLLLNSLVDGDYNWYLYSDRRLKFQTKENVVVRVGKINSRFLSTAFAQLVFPVWSRMDDLDLFWSPRHHLPLLAGPRKHLLTIHDMVWLKEPQTMRRFGRLTERMLMPQSIRQADAILTPSKSTADDIGEYLPGAKAKIHVTPLASSLTTSAAARAGAVEKSILMVGSIEPRKNIQLALDAYLRLKENTTDPVKLVIAGGAGWKSDILHNRLRAARQHNVEYLGAVGDDVLADLYANAHIVLVPSLYEGFGLAAVEAMSFGKPVVASNLSSLPEVVGDAGLFVDPRSSEEIFVALYRLLTESDLYQQLSEAAMARSSEYSWHKCACQTRTVIDQLMFAEND